MKIASIMNFCREICKLQISPIKQRFWKYGSRACFGGSSFSKSFINFICCIIITNTKCCIFKVKNFEALYKKKIVKEQCFIKDCIESNSKF